MKKLEKLNKILYTIIFASITLLVFIMSIEEPNLSFYSNDKESIKFLMGLALSLKEFDIMYVTIGIFIYYTYYNIYFDETPLTKKSFINCAIAIVLTFVTITGKSFEVDNTLGTIFNTKAQILKCILLSFGYYFMYYAILKKVSSIKITTNSKKKSPFWEKVINKHQTLIGIIIILLGWLPYIIFYFPGASTGDTFDSLCQFFHQSNSWSIQTINLINEDVYINKHHPPLFTVVLGLIFKFGKYLGSFDIGAFLYTILQVSLLLIIFSFMLKYMKKNKIPLWLRIFSILFLALTPTVAAHAISAIKDTPNAIFTLLYIIFLLQIIRNYDSIFKRKIRLIALIITMLLVLMLRNNGIFTIILSFPFLIFVYKNKWKNISAVLIVCLLIFGIYDKIILPHYDVTDGSIKEVLTIPFMQVARLAYFQPDAISEEDINKIDKVIDYKLIQGNYDPSLADGVKDRYKKDCTEEELKEFFRIWFKYLKKYPQVYIESIMNSTYGYFFPEVGDKYAYLAVDRRVGEGTYINLKALKQYKEERNIIDVYNDMLAKLPFTFFFTHVAFYDWALIFSCIYVVMKKKYKYLIPLLPLVSVLLVCIASPINGSFRYILPIVFSLPIILGIDYFVSVE